MSYSSSAKQERYAKAAKSPLHLFEEVVRRGLT
jgi:hypothetical protein